jgi:hypothetical protein
MKRLFYGFVISMLLAQVSWGAIPRTMNYQGYLTDGSGKVVSDSTYQFTLTLYDAATDGNAVWTEIQSVKVVGGIYNVILGNDTPLDIAFDQQYWLGISIDNGAELTPRTQLTSSPYSLGGDFWRLTGNAGTSPPTNFLGTIDDTPLELWVNNLRVLRLEPNTDSPNVIGGFSGNSVTPNVSGATICGGGVNENANTVTAPYGTVGGGLGNGANSYFATVSGGRGNNASGQIATVGGGQDNETSGSYATISGGRNNKASGNFATLGGGYGNDVGGRYSTVSGGSNNTASGDEIVGGATVGGGQDNEASGNFSTVPGGFGNRAIGKYSFAAGLNAKADEHGSFIFADGTNTGPVIFNSKYPGNDFSVLCTGGARFVAAWNPDTGDATGVRLAPGGASWSPMCDRHVKANFAKVDARGTLERLASIPIETWNYKAQDPSIRHIGPVAQDFYAAFGLGEDDKHISTVDADGVALAAIQGLYELVKEKDKEIAAQHQQAIELRVENTALQHRIDDLEMRLKAIEALLMKQASQ